MTPERSPTAPGDSALDRQGLDAGSAGLHRRLYDWVLRWARTPYGVPALFALAFAESSFFPLPPDVLLLALGVARPRRAFWYATVCSAGSVLGGVLGYAIGFYTWEVTRGIFFTYVPGFTEAGFMRVQALYTQYGFAAVMVAGFTPIPYKVFTIASGVFAMNLPLFVLASGCSRTARFFMEGALLFHFGGRIQELLDRYFNLLSIVFVALLVLGFVVIRLFG